MFSRDNRLYAAWVVALVATLGSALAGVIGMFLVILNWLYPRSDKPDGK